MNLILHSWPGFTMEQRLQPTVPVGGSLWMSGEQNWTYPIPLALMVGGTQYEWVHWISMVVETADKTPCGFHHRNTTQYMLQSHTFSWNKASWFIYHKSVCSDVYRSSVPRDYIDRATFSMFAAFQFTVIWILNNQYLIQRLCKYVSDQSLSAHNFIITIYNVSVLEDLLRHTVPRHFCKTDYVQPGVW